MALVKRTYVDGETIITAQNLNDIQDEIISHANTFVPKTRTINSKALDANITLTASDLGAVPTTRTVNSKALSSNITLTAADVSAVPTTRTVNSKALSSNITLTAADVGAVPTTRTVNSKALSSDITLTSGDIGYNSSTTYTSGSVGKAVSDLNGAISVIGTTYTDADSVSVASSAETTTSTITVSKGLYLVTLYGIAYSLSANCILQFAITLNNAIQTALRITAQSSPNNLYRVPLTAIVNVTADNSTIASNIYQTSGSAVNTDTRLTAVRLK